MAKTPILEPDVPHLKEDLCLGDGPYRPNVAAMVIRHGKAGPEILLGERFDSAGCWQWPQGGRKKKEKAKHALFRELKEEIGVDDVKILYRFPFKLRYRFPTSLARNFNGRIGQEQTYFVVTPGETPPDLAKAEDKEFRALQWFLLRDAYQHATWFKRGVYNAALDHLLVVLPGLNF